MKLVLRGQKPSPWVGFWMCPVCQSVYQVNKTDTVPDATTGKATVKYVESGTSAAVIIADCQVCDVQGREMHRNTIPLPPEVTGIPRPPVLAPVPVEPAPVESAPIRQRDPVTGEFLSTVPPVST